MKKIVRGSIAAAIAMNAMNACAIGNGFYLGIMMGPATNNGSIIQAQAATPVPPPLVLTPATPRSQQFAARIFLGNQFNQYAAIELGGTFFSQINYDTRGVPTAGGTNQRVRDIDLVGKGILPFYAFNVYGKAGIAALYITTSGGLNPTYVPARPDDTNSAIIRGSTTYSHKFAPTFSLGAAYDINQSWEADLSLNVLVVGGSINRMTYYALGISYHFTDKYCGQFLCDD